jgi:hypothetical protein
MQTKLDTRFEYTLFDAQPTELPTTTISVADPDPGSRAFLTPGSGMGKNQDPDP